MSKQLFLCGLFLLILSFFYMTNDIIKVDAYQGEISIIFEFGTREYCYNTSEHELDTNFYFKSELSKHGRGGNHIERAKLLRKLLNMKIEPIMAIGYCFCGLDELILKLKDEIDCEPVDATYRFTPNKTPNFTFTKDRCGYKLDIDQLVGAILNEIEKTNSVIIKLKPQILLPLVKYEDIIDYQNVKSSFYTTFVVTNEDRKHNINLALDRLNGLEISPNKTYSFNALTGRRTEKAGYRPAKIIVDKKYVEGIGGGVCQVSSTLYNALLLAGVEVTEVHNHSLCSNYVDLGFDAMVNFGSADLKWENYSTHPVFVKANVEGNRVNVTIFGKDDGRTLKRVNEIEAEENPPSDEIFIDEKQEYTHLVNYTDEEEYIQLPHKGYVVRAFLEEYKDGKLVDRKFLRRVKYKPSAGIKVRGNIERRNKELDGDVINFWQKYKYY